VLRDLLDGVRRRLYHLLAQLPVLVARPRRSLASLVLPVVSLVAEDLRHPASLGHQVAFLLPDFLAVRPVSLDSPLEVPLLGLTRLDGDEDNDFWSMLTIPRPRINRRLAL